MNNLSLKRQILSFEAQVIQYVILIWFTDNPILDDLLPKHKSKVLDALSTEIAMK